MSTIQAQASQVRPCIDVHPDPFEWESSCRTCWLVIHHSTYQKAWGAAETKISFPQPTPQIQPRKAIRSLPCISEGQVIEYCTCDGPQADLRNVRECDLHDRTTRQFVSPLVRNCGDCSDYGLALRHSQGGLGDAVVAFYAACGLANTGMRVHFHTHHRHWFSFHSHPRVEVLPPNPDAVDCCGDYEGQMQAAAERRSFTRGQWFCDQFAKLAGIERFTPARPESFAPSPSPIAAGAVILAPFSNDQTREYPGFRWPEIASRLISAGHDVIALGAISETGKLKELFHNVPMTWYYGKTAQWIVSALAASKLLIGNDSGLTHVAGLVGIPAIAVMSHMPPEVVFGDAPSVRGVTPGGWTCNGCSWKAPRFRGDPCTGRCDALFSVMPEAVLAEASRLLNR